MSELNAVWETVLAGLRAGKTPVYDNRVLSVTEDIEREDICRHTGLPFLPLIVPDWSPAAFLVEVQEIFKAHPGEKKILLFDCNRPDNPLLSQCTHVASWLEGLIQRRYYTEFHRIEAVLLEPEGYIPFHRERPEELRALWPLNLALNGTDKQYWVFKDFGPVPFYNGGAYATDISYEFGVINASGENRIHLILHGDCHEGYAEAVRRSLLRAQLTLRQEAGPIAPHPLPEPNRKVRFAIWRRYEGSVPAELQDICESMTLHFLRLRSQALAPALVDISASRILHEAEAGGADWCVVIAPGRIFKKDFVEEFFEILEKSSANVAAYTLPGGDFKILAVNLKLWRELGSPAIDSSLADKILSSGYELRDFTGNIIEHSLFLRPEINSASVLKNLLVPEGSGPLLPEQQHCMEYLAVERGAGRRKIYPFNTESYLDVLRRQDKRPLDGIFSVAAGLKDLFILHHHGFHESTRLMYFDICPESLEYKKHFFQNWNGRNYPDFVRQAEALNLPQLAGANFVNTNLEIMREWEREILYWGGEDAIEHTFLKARALDTEFKQLNIVRNPELLARWLDELPDGGHYGLWFSNCFNYTPTLAENGWSLRFIAQQGLKLLQELEIAARRKNIQIEIYGEDVLWGTRSSFTQKKLHEVFV